MTTQKLQLNVYVPKEIDEYIERIVDTVENVVSKSEFVHLLVAYARQHFTEEDWSVLAMQMRILGEFGLEEVSHDGQEG